jgi:hypothetical protein
VIGVTRIWRVRPDMPSVMSEQTGPSEPGGPTLGLVAALAFAFAILCLVSFVVFGA